jgi:hypothetical protein
MRRRVAAIGLGLVFAALSAGAVAARDDGGRTAAKAAKRAPIRFEQQDLFIEYNATAGDAGLQVNVDAENWKRFQLFDPRGRRLMDFTTRGRLRPIGLSELFVEASEPPFTTLPFSEFKRRFPEGVYRFRGIAGNGRRLAGADRLSHLIPAPPTVRFPVKGARVDPGGFSVRWQRVTSPPGVRIVTYQVIVIQGKRELSMYVPPDVTRVRIPGAFLEPGRKLEGEVLAREASGNQTIAEMPSFRTRGR